MIDTGTAKGKLVSAALDLAKVRPWSELSMLDIARAAGLSLDEMRRAVGSKSQLLAQFMRMVDDEVLKRAPGAVVTGDGRRDALFDVIMNRFDVLAPYKEALRSIARAAPADLGLIGPALNSQRWMLAAAGIDADGFSGLVRTGGMASLYASVMRTWLDDDDPGHARTMAALDRRLRRSESAIRSFDDTVGLARRLATDLPGVLSDTANRIFRRPKTDDAASTGARPTTSRGEDMTPTI